VFKFERQCRHRAYAGLSERENHVAAGALTMIWHGVSRERVARVLWDLAARIAAPGPVRAGVTLKEQITKRLIGCATGLPSIHVDRVFLQLKEQQIIEIQERTIVIIDPQVLSVVANDRSLSILVY
jgi:CRP-like cAMP-binding protein